MKRIICTTLLAGLLPMSAFAVDNVGTCGWGSKLFDGQKGVVPQVLAVTTNGTSGNQTFGITSGTSGCTQEGVVKSNWRTAAYIDSNMNKLARDMSRGEGESLDSLAQVAGVSAKDTLAFKGLVKANFDKIFASADVSSQSVVANLHSVVAQDAALSQYAANI